MNILSRMVTSIIFIAIFIAPIFILMNFDLPLLGDHRILIQNLFFDTDSQYLNMLMIWFMKSIILNLMQSDYNLLYFCFMAFDLYVWIFLVIPEKFIGQDSQENTYLFGLFPC